MVTVLRRFGGWAYVSIVLAGLFMATSAHAADSVRIAVGNDFAPFEYQDENGNPTGLIVDLWTLWSKRTGTPIEFKSAPWSETLDMVKDGRADVHAGLNKTPERQVYLNYGEPLLTSNIYIFSPKGIDLTGDFKDLAGFRIGVLDGSLEHAHLPRVAPGAEVVAYPTTGALYDAVLNKEIRFFADVEQTALFFLAERNLDGLYQYNASAPLAENYLYVAAKKGRSDLVETVNAGLNQITPNDRRKLTKAWLGPVAKQATDSLVIAVSRNYPPFTVTDVNGAPAGMLVDIWRLWSRKTGRKIEFKQSSWADTLYALRNGEADIHSGLFRSASRAQWIDFSRPVYQITSSHYHRVGADLPQTFQNVNMGAMFGSFQEAYLRETEPKAHVLGYRDDEEVFRALSQGDIDVSLSEDATVEAMLGRLGLQGAIVSTGPPVLENDLFFGVRKGDGELLTLIERGLDLISRKELAEIEARWVLNPDNQIFSKQELALTAKQHAFIKSHPKIRVHNESDWEPFNFFKEGRPQGFSIDYMNMLARDIGVEVEYVTGPTWGEFLGLVKNKNLDVMLNIIKTPKRDQYIAFTEPYVENPPVLVIKDDNTSVQKFDDLFGKTLAIPDGFFYQEIIEREFPEINLMLLDGQPDCLKAVAVGKADATIGGIAIQTDLMRKLFLTNLRFIGELPEETFANRLRLGVRDDWPVLRDILQKAIDAADQGEIRRLQQKWLGDVLAKAPAQAVVELSADERAWLEQHSTFRLGIDPQFHPLEFIDDGTYQGLSADIINHINGTFGMSFIPGDNRTWAEAFELFEKGEIDILPSAFHTTAREELMNFTEPYMSFPIMLFTQNDADFVAGLEDMDGRTVAIPENYAAVHFVQKDFPNVKIVETKTVAEALEAVSVGRVDGYVGNLATATYFIEQLNMSNVKVAAPTPFSADLRMGVRKDWPELVSILDKVLAAIPDEDKSAMRAKWVSLRFEHAVDTAALVRVGLQVAGVSVLILVLILMWNRRLKIEVNQRKRAEAQANEERLKALEASDAKSKFLTMMSHDLRTPLNTIMGYALMMEEDADDDGVPQEIRDSAKAINRNSGHLHRIIDDIIAMSRVESGRYEITPEPIDAELIAKESLSLSVGPATERWVKIRVEGADTIPTFEADPIALKHMIINLLSNAIRHSSEHGEITLQFAQDGKDALVRVLDQGEGMTPEQIKIARETFGQAGSSDKRKGGSGIGLTVVDRFIKLHGGHLDIQSKPGAGTTMTLVFPGCF
ncbi:transporter substrate-binding domain-containing protein [Magnetovibrio sp. PR-2]|uniref:transporter substrate-binding domain-containing protein n=1 Tax=Magnetovibrio sp. PR-2 TaxID=3120356 RepID=UPI002FCDE607